MLGVVSAHIGVMERIACGFGVYGQGVGGLLSLPLLDQRVDCINKAVLRHGVEEADDRRWWRGGGCQWVFG